MPPPYTIADVMALRRVLLPFRKKETVMGIMGHTQGVTNAMRPPMKPAMNIYHSERDCCTGSSLNTLISASTLAHHLSALTPLMLAAGVMNASEPCSESVMAVTASTTLSFFSFSASFKASASFLTASVTGAVPLNACEPRTRKHPCSSHT